MEQGDGAAPDDVELDDYLYTDSAVIAIEGLTEAMRVVFTGTCKMRMTAMSLTCRTLVP